MSSEFSPFGGSSTFGTEASDDDYDGLGSSRDLGSEEYKSITDAHDAGQSGAKAAGEGVGSSSERMFLIGRVNNDALRFQRSESGSSSSCKETLRVNKREKDEYGELRRINQYIFLKEIGVGATAEVKLCEICSNEGESNRNSAEGSPLVAVKVFNKSLLRRGTTKKQFTGKRRPRRRTFTNASGSSDLGSACSDKWTSGSRGPAAAGGLVPQTVPSSLVDHIEDNSDIENAALKEVRREIAIMKKLVHPNVVRLVEVIDDMKDDMLYVVMEYVGGGAIMSWDPFEATYIYPETGTTLGPAMAASCFVDVMLGLEFLHANHIVHRDLKPENVLLTADGTAKIADFGGAYNFEHFEETAVAQQEEEQHEGPRLRASSSTSTTSTSSRGASKRSRSRGNLFKGEGTWAFWAPEIIITERMRHANRHNYDSNEAVSDNGPANRHAGRLSSGRRRMLGKWKMAGDGHWTGRELDNEQLDKDDDNLDDLVPRFDGYQADVWAAGMLLWVFLWGRPPFYDENTETLFDNIIELPLTFPPSLPLEEVDLRTLLTGLLAKDPIQRVTIEEALCNGWVGDVVAQRERPDYSVTQALMQVSEVELSNAILNVNQLIVIAMVKHRLRWRLHQARQNIRDRNSQRAHKMKKSVSLDSAVLNNRREGGEEQVDEENDDMLDNSGWNMRPTHTEAVQLGGVKVTLSLPSMRPPSRSLPAIHSPSLVPSPRSSTSRSASTTIITKPAIAKNTSCDAAAAAAAVDAAGVNAACAVEPLGSETLLAPKRFDTGQPASGPASDDEIGSCPPSPPPRLKARLGIDSIKKEGSVRSEAKEGEPSAGEGKGAAIKGSVEAVKAAAGGRGETGGGGGVEGERGLEEAESVRGEGHGYDGDAAQNEENRDDGSVDSRGDFFSFTGCGCTCSVM